jgi:hypothetical protein
MTVPPGIGQQFTCKFTSLMNFAQLRAELPLNGLTFSKTLNAPGAWQATLPVEDLGIRRSAWQEATAVNRTALWVDVGGALLYGGMVQQRKYTMSTGQLTLSGNDFCGYLSQRLQANDYKEYRSWATTGASALEIANTVISQALERAYSIPIRTAVSAVGPEKRYWITFSAPETQQQTVASILSQLQELGYLTGIDYACDVAFSAKGVPEATITLSYPRRGSGTPVVIDLSGATELEYDEDGTQQADRIVEQAGATIDRTGAGQWAPTRDAGYPLLEAEVSHTALAPSEATAAVLRAYVEGSLAARAYPLTAPVVTLPMFGSPSIFELNVGDDVILRIPKVAGAQPLTNPRFPEGLEAPFRIVRIDCEVPDQGVPTMALTLNIPLGLAPAEPPELDREAKEAKEKEELEKREKEKKEQEEKEAEAKKEAEEKEKEAIEKEEAENLEKAEEAEAIAKEAEEAAAIAKTEAEAEGNARKEKEAQKAKEEAEAIKHKAEKHRIKIKGRKEGKGKGKHKAEVEREKEEVGGIKEEAERSKVGAEIIKLPSGGSYRLKIITNTAGEESATGVVQEVEGPGLVTIILLNEFAINIKVDGKLLLSRTLKANSSVTFMVEKKYSVAGGGNILGFYQPVAVV